MTSDLSVTKSDQIEDMELALCHIHLSFLWHIPISHLDHPVILQLQLHSSWYNHLLFIGIGGVLLIVEAESWVALLVEDAEDEEDRFV